MRWVYTMPEKKEFVSDGRRVYSYIPADRQVIVTPLPQDDEATTPALFLAGKGDIARDFTATTAEPVVPGTTALKLTPRQEAPSSPTPTTAASPSTRFGFFHGEVVARDAEVLGRHPYAASAIREVARRISAPRPLSTP